MRVGDAQCGAITGPVATPLSLPCFGTGGFASLPYDRFAH
jgi:hypothetical protein